MHKPRQALRARGLQVMRMFEGRRLRVARKKQPAAS